MNHIVVSLFSGAGGLDIGFEQAGCQVRVAVEMDTSACRTLRHNRPRLAVVQKDITTVTADELLTAGHIPPGKVWAVVGGPPCQGFSQIGKKDPKDPRNFMYREYLRLVDGLKPKFFLMENTAAITFSRNRPVFLQVITAAQEIGYAVGWKVLNAADYGVPQMRKRCFLIGHRLPDFGAYTLPPRTVGDAINDLINKEIQDNG